MQELMSELVHRIDQFQHGHRDAVLGPPVQNLTDELRREARTAPEDGHGAPNGQPSDDLPAEIRQVLGWVHWCRYLAMPPGPDQDEFHAAFAQFSHLVQTHPDTVPVQIRDQVAEATDDAPESDSWQD